MSLAGFARLQTAENRLIPALLADINPAWLLEIAPLRSSSPALDQPRSRLLLDAEGIGWPFRARLDELPLDADSVPAVMVRHLWQPGVGCDPLTDVARILKPGGYLISVSANPWHAQAWREISYQALSLPSWPHWQLQHARHPLELTMPTSARWKALVPGLSPVLVLVARKPRRPARVEPLKFKRPQVAGATAAATHCRAA